MSREHMNNVILAGPMSKFQVYGKDNFGGTGVSFLVGQPDGPALRVSGKIKLDWMLQQGQNSQSVMVMKGYMNGWEKEGKLTFNLGARAGGLYFLNHMVESCCQAEVEGVVVQVSGQWVTVHSSYTVPGQGGGQGQSRHRVVVCRFPVDQDPRAVGNLALALGRPNPKLGDQWYLHLEVQRGWILWGKK
jgi:hypothetical protein